MTCVTGRVSPKCLECGALPLGGVHGQGLKGQVWPWGGRGSGESKRRAGGLVISSFSLTVIQNDLKWLPINCGTFCKTKGVKSKQEAG